MDIDSRSEFPADPARVFAMLTDQSFLEQVCQRTHATSYQVSVEGSLTKTTRELPAPDQARPFTGDKLIVIEEITWSEAGADGNRTATTTMKVPGQPVSFNGQYELTAGGAGSALQLIGVLKVNVPLLGKKLEQSAAPAVMAGFKAQEKLGADWLAG